MPTTATAVGGTTDRKENSGGGGTAGSFDLGTGFSKSKSSRIMGKVIGGRDDRRTLQCGSLTQAPNLYFQFARQMIYFLCPRNHKSRLEKRNVNAQAKVLTIIQGGHVKISSPSLRPRLYLYPGDKGYVGGGSATGTSPKGDGGGGSDGTSRGPGGVGAADRRAESERQVRRGYSRQT